MENLLSVEQEDAIRKDMAMRWLAAARYSIRRSSPRAKNEVVLARGLSLEDLFLLDLEKNTLMKRIEALRGLMRYPQGKTVNEVAFGGGLSALKRELACLLTNSSLNDIRSEIIGVLVSRFAADPSLWGGVMLGNSLLAAY